MNFDDDASLPKDRKFKIQKSRNLTLKLEFVVFTAHQ